MQNEKSLSLRSPELLPTKDSERNLSLWDYTILWAGMTINIVAFSLGADYHPGCWYLWYFWATALLRS